MLLGAAGNLPERRNWLLAGADRQTRILNGGEAALVLSPWGMPTLDGVQRWAEDEPTGSWLALSGRPLYGDAPPGDGGPPGAGSLLARLLESGPAALVAVDGAFAIAWFDGRSNRLHLIRDRFGIEPLFYADLDRAMLFGSRLRDLRASGALSGALDGRGLAEFLSYCYVPGEATLDRSVRRVPAGSWIEFDPHSGTSRQQRWYRLSFAAPPEPFRS